MSYWNEVKEVLVKGAGLAIDGIKEGADSVLFKTRDGADSVADKAKDGASFVKLKTNLYLKQREYQTVLADLGDAVHDIYKEKKDLYGDPNIEKIIEKATGIEDECKKMKSELDELGRKEEQAKEEEKKTE